MIKLNQFERDIELFVNEDDDDEEDDDEELKISKKMVGIFMKARNVMWEKCHSQKWIPVEKTGKGLQILFSVSEMFKR